MKIKKILIHKDKKFYWKSGDLHTQFGLIKGSDIKTKPIVYSNKGIEFQVIPASFLDNLEKIKRGPQIMLPKDIGIIITRANINKDSKVLEIGTGSGVLTAFLAKIAKQVVSYEIREDHYKIAKKNLEELGIKNIKLINQDASLKIKEKNFDVAVIDIKQPWNVIKNVSLVLKSGAYIASYSPSINQTQLLLKEVKKLNLTHLKTVEILEREWDTIKNHPVPRIVAHTAFISFLRKN